MQILTLLSKIIDDALNTLSHFDCWEDDEKVYYSGEIITEEVMSILDVDDVNSDCVVTFEADENNYFGIDTIEYNNNIHDVSKTINEYMKSQGLDDIYHRLCEEAVNLAVL